MRNVTITMDDTTAQWVRVEAARQDVSMSRFIGDLLRSQMTDADDYERSYRAWRRRKPVPLGEPGQPYPSRDEVHQR